ncbi:hypothetical protein [Natrinema sp. 1APR25-10V2]|uniref:hypothetical protein n=1 Tax=Natrinema sp. 1APR25-10V2 TaxID=2951081 RepID=UPI002874E357|nr:hypothetical protein [Natrinema sp. 1APR25-10V2]MDS0477039.1 hypothetical protein [Natrinema sp. 1APR25-10V2]
MTDTENLLPASDASSESAPERRKAVEALLTETSRVVSPDATLYYVWIQFDDSYSELAHRERILVELDNALDIRSARPQLEEFSSADTEIELLLETRIEPESVVKALDHDCIDSVTYWVVDPDAFDLEVAETAKADGRSAAAEFEQLRQQYTADADETATDLGTGTFEFTEPCTVSFSDDEVEFAELLSGADGEEDAENTTSGRQTDSLLGALVAELEAGTADPTDVATLCEYIDRQRSETSLEVRLNHVQERMDTFAAYLDALEEFLDEEGTAQQLLEEIHTELGDLRDDLESAATEREELRTRLTELEATAPAADEVEAEFARVDTQIETVVDEVREEVGDIDARLETLHAELEEQQEWRRRLSAVVATDAPAAADSDET